MTDIRKNYDKLERSINEVKYLYKIKPNKNFTGIVVKNINSNSKEVYIYINYYPVFIGFLMIFSTFSFFFFIWELINDLNAYHTGYFLNLFHQINSTTYDLLLLSSIPYTSILLLIFNFFFILYIYKKAISIFRKNG